MDEFSGFVLNNENSKASSISNNKSKFSESGTLLTESLEKLRSLEDESLVKFVEVITNQMQTSQNLINEISSLETKIKNAAQQVEIDRLSSLGNN